MEMTETSFHKEFPFDEGCMVFFFDLGILFLDLYVSFRPGRIFLWDLGAQKLWGTCLCVFWSLFFFFGVDLHGSLPSPFFFDNYDLGFFFFGAVHLLRGPCLQKGGTQLL